MKRSRCLPPDPDNLNDDRATWAAEAVRHFRRVTGADWNDAVSDLLCDLMHLCDRQPVERGQQPMQFERELERARQNYWAETDGLGGQLGTSTAHFTG